MTTLNFGSWESPITSEFITANQIKLAELGINAAKDEFYWVEGRPTEGGRQVVVRNCEGENTDLTPDGVNSRSRVHEYGGGAFCATETNGLIVTVDFKTQDVLLVNGQESTRVATGDSGVYRYGDFVVDPSPARQLIYAIQEDHTIDEPSKVLNSIVSISLHCNEEPIPLVNVERNPQMLYASPRVDSTGQLLCWVQWTLPSMPWDSSELYVGRLAQDGASIIATQRIAGGSRESVQLPSWGPVAADDKMSLFYISDRSHGWWSFHRARLSISSIHEGLSANIESSCLLQCIGYEFGVSTWNLGIRLYDFLEDGRLFCLWKDGTGSLCGVACTTDSEHVLHVSDTAKEASRDDRGLTVVAMPAVCGSSAEQHLTSCTRMVVGTEDVVYVIGGSPALPAGVFRWDTAGVFSQHASGHNYDDSGFAGRVTTVRSSMPAISSLDSRFISAPEDITFPTVVNGQATTAHGNYYAPRNPLFRAPPGALPPLLVKLHGGPTGQAATVCRFDIQFFTSRGIAVLDVNYGGSTGYGREYRERLYGLWGVVDVEDCCMGAEYLVGRGLVHRDMLAIDGGSAGGFTTLACVTFRDTFKAATSSYGIGDLDALLHETHKLESRYTDLLLGPYPECKHVFDERSPIKHIDRLSCPLLLLQGADDRVVPPNQAVMMYNAVVEKGFPAALVMFEGEGHGFRKAESIQRALNLELNFYGLIFGFVPDIRERVPLHNYDGPSCEE